MKKANFLCGLLILLGLLPLSTMVNGQMVSPIKKGYFPVNGLTMYYEIQGKGNPVVLLHGAYMSLEGPMRELIGELSKTHQA
jgi:hypothetical protein